MTLSEVEELLSYIDQEEGNLSLDQVEDDRTGRVYWQCEVDGHWFEASTAFECFAKAADHFWRRSRGEDVPGSHDERLFGFDEQQENE